MAEAVGSAFSWPDGGLVDGQFGQRQIISFVLRKQMKRAPVRRHFIPRQVRNVRQMAEKKTPRNARRFHIDRKFLPNYFDTDFLNARSIFSLVASQQAWLAWAACRAWLAALCALSADDFAD